LDATPFWKEKKIEEFTQEEWESVCDGCGKCCLFRLEGEIGEYYTTNIICKLFDEATCQCTDYLNRQKVVPTCLVLDANYLCLPFAG
jgi:uncharacterized cysteine cluster protein YcgN (CxxCxxCC family)